MPGSQRFSKMNDAEIYYFGYAYSAVFAPPDWAFLDRRWVYVAQEVEAQSLENRSKNHAASLISSENCLERARMWRL